MNYFELTTSESKIIGRKIGEILRGINDAGLPLKLTKRIETFEQLENAVSDLRRQYESARCLMELERVVNGLDLTFMNTSVEIAGSEVSEENLDNSMNVLIAENEQKHDLTIDAPEKAVLPVLTIEPVRDSFEVRQRRFVDYANTEKFNNFDIRAQIALMKFNACDYDGECYMVDDDGNITPRDAAWNLLMTKPKTTLGHRVFMDMYNGITPFSYKMYDILSKHEIMLLNEKFGNLEDPFPAGFCWLLLFEEEEHAWLTELFEPMIKIFEVIAILLAFPDTKLLPFTKEVHHYVTSIRDGMEEHGHYTKQYTNRGFHYSHNAASPYNYIAHSVLRECRGLTQSDADMIYTKLNSTLVWYCSNVDGTVQRVVSAENVEYIRDRDFSYLEDFFFDHAPNEAIDFYMDLLKREKF